MNEFFCFLKCLCIPFQRYRYAEAYQVHLKLEKVEEDSISEGSVSEEGLSRIKTASHWRANLVVSDLKL